jgi:putative colanic acid biosynthesis acetyltransferase WcaB
MFLSCIRADFAANRHCVRALLLVFVFRILSFCRTRRVLFWLSVPLWVAYKFYSEVLLHVELSPRTKVGVGLSLPHPFGIVINSNTIIGDHCTLRHCTTIGNKGTGRSSGCPTLGNHVDVGSNCVIIGAVVIGDNTAVGAGSVVTKSLERNHVYCGNPVRLIR